MTIHKLNCGIIDNLDDAILEALHKIDTANLNDNERINPITSSNIEFESEFHNINSNSNQTSNSISNTTFIKNNSIPVATSNQNRYAFIKYDSM